MPPIATQIVPIFMRRGCVNCHSGNGPGRNLGGLTLDGSVVIDYRNVVTNISPDFGITRVDLKSGTRTLWREAVPPDRSGLINVGPIFTTSDGKISVYSYTRLLSALYIVTREE